MLMRFHSKLTWTIYPLLGIKACDTHFQGGGVNMSSIWTTYLETLKGLLPRYLQKVAKGGMAPSTME